MGINEERNRKPCKSNTFNIYKQFKSTIRGGLVSSTKNQATKERKINQRHPSLSEPLHNGNVAPL